MSTILEIAREFGGQDDPIKKGMKEYVPVTERQMAEATSARIAEAIEAAERGEALSPIVRKLFNGYQVKIGYGTRNEKIVGMPELHFPNLHAVSEFLSLVRKMVDEGECDENFHVLLESYRERAEAGKKARRRNKEEAIAA